jgi:hypothetical protein
MRWTIRVWLSFLPLFLACDTTGEWDDDWWTAGDGACLDGAVLIGAPYPGEGSSKYGWAVGCTLKGAPLHPYLDWDEEKGEVVVQGVDGPTRLSVAQLRTNSNHGRSTFWHSNGQKRREAEYDHGQVIRAMEYSDRGEVVKQVKSTPGSNGERPQQHELTWTFWHDNGRRAVEAHRKMGQRDGLWTHWNESGEVIGQVRFEYDQPKEVTVPPATLLLSDPFGAMDLHPVALAALPISVSHTTPSIGPTVQVRGDQLLIDGSPILHLEGGLVAASDRRGHLVSRLHDRLLDKRSQMRDLEAKTEKPGQGAEMVFQLPPDTPFALVRMLMYTGGQAQFSRFTFQTYDPAVRWPAIGPEPVAGRHPRFGVTVTLPEIGPPDASRTPEMFAETHVSFTSSSVEIHGAWPRSSLKVVGRQACPSSGCTDEDLAAVSALVASIAPSSRQKIFLGLDETMKLGRIIFVIDAVSTSRSDGSRPKVVLASSEFVGKPFPPMPPR